MRKLLSSPVGMTLNEVENQIYQNALSHSSELSLNLMAVKVTERPENFLDWCKELYRLCRQELNLDLLEPTQLVPLKKLQTALEAGINMSQIKTLKIAPWPVYAQFLQQQSEAQSLNERLRLLSHINSLQAKPLADMIVEDRLAFIGKHTNKHEPSLYDFDCEWFGSTKGAKVFHQLLADLPAEFDTLLAHIPATGEVTETDYKNFVSAYHALFAEFSAGSKAPLAAATRLLAMRRPDQFIALTNSKIESLCQGFDIPKFKNTDFNAYWTDLIGGLRGFSWWKASEPEDALEATLWQNRAILVDCFLFADEKQAANSNYIKLRDKPKKAKSTSSKAGVKRSKASAKELVDRALAAEGISNNVKAQRSSILNQVESGKSVDAVIKLMQAIFS